MIRTTWLTIADVAIALSSRYPVESFTKDLDWRFRNFLSRPKRRADIRIAVEVADQLPRATAARDLFVTTHFQNGAENWRLQQQDGRYIFRCPLDDKQQHAVINRAFTRATLWLHPQRDGRRAWNLSNVIYDFLQILLINYLAQRDGVFVHGVGLRDVDGTGRLFVGKSGAGKSTTARLWHRHTRATILNDDRIIVRRKRRRFVMYGTPWHGDFSDYLSSAIVPTPLARLFFIHHASRHAVQPLSQDQAFCELYPCLFPTFWDRQGLDRTATLCQDLIATVPMARLGFRKDRSVIPFVRRDCW